MAVCQVRATIFVVLQLLFAAAINALDPTIRTRAQKLEIVYLIDIAETGNLAPGNTIQTITSRAGAVDPVAPWRGLHVGQIHEMAQELADLHP